MKRMRALLPCAVVLLTALAQCSAPVRTGSAAGAVNACAKMGAVDSRCTLKPHVGGACSFDAVECDYCEVSTLCNCAADCELECVAGDCSLLEYCNSDSDCAGMDGPKVCDTAAQLCVACVADSDCVSGTSVAAGGAHCVSDTHMCVECLSDSDCVSGITVAAGGPHCSPDSHTCVHCLVDVDCAGNPAGPKCSPGLECAMCVSNDDCDQKAGCYNGACICPPSGDCGAGLICRADNSFSVQTCEPGCDATHPCDSTHICDLASQVCQPRRCVQDADCKDPELSRCDANGNCSGCDPNQSSCAAGFYCGAIGVAFGCLPGCVANTDCAAPAPACDPLFHVCVACVVDADCPAGQTCHSGFSRSCGP